jgi:hypothetical protein
MALPRNIRISIATESILKLSSDSVDSNIFQERLVQPRLLAWEFITELLTSAARQAGVLVCERSPTNALDAEGRKS